MPGIGQNNNVFPTPGRKTHVRFDLNVPFVQEPAYSFGRPAQAMFKGSDTQALGLEYTAGWGIRAYQEDTSVFVERTEADSGVITSGFATIASGWQEIYGWKKPQSGEMPNATVGASTFLADQGFTMFRKSITAGTDWDDNVLSADQTAFPGPGDDNPYGLDETIVLDRAFVSDANDSSEKPILFITSIYGGLFRSPDTIARLYFNGPAGKNSDGRGTGQYCLCLKGTGRAVVFEKQYASSNWLKRFEMANAVGKQYHNSYFFVRIYKSKECVPPGHGSNGYIKFDFMATDPHFHEYSETPGDLVRQLSSLAVTSIGLNNIQKFHYRVPNIDDGNYGTTNSPLRVDFRRDLMGTFSVHNFKYPTSEITADDSEFELTFIPTEEDPDNEGYCLEPIELYYNGCIPSGCSLNAKLFRADTGVELPLLATVGRHKTYSLPVGVTRYFIRFVIQTDGNRTPLIWEFRVQRNGVLANTGISSWEIGDASHVKSVLRRVSIKGPERDLSHESADIEVADPLNTLSELKLRASMPMKIETEYDASDTSKRCTLFRGFMEVATAKRGKPGPNSYPVEGWNHFNLKCKGIWQQLQENFIDTPITFVTDPVTSQPYKVTDLIKAIISRIGFDSDTEFEFPDIPTLIGIETDLDYSQTIDMLESCAAVVKSLARDYLAHFLIFDSNIGTQGKWRLVANPVSPYTNVAHFTMDHPGAGKLAHYLPSYGVDGDGVPKFGIVGRTVETYVKKPEANWILVASWGAWDNSPGQIYMTTLYNPNSYGPTADPTNNPDYLGRRVPIYVIDPALGTAKNAILMKSTIDALARRIADLTFHSIKMMTFDAPLVLIDHELNGTTGYESLDAKRPLRYYDPVLVDGTQFLIRNVNPSYNKDGIQYATYELEAPRF